MTQEPTAWTFDAEIEGHGWTKPGTFIQYPTQERATAEATKILLQFEDVKAVHVHPVVEEME